MDNISNVNRSSESPPHKRRTLVVRDTGGRNLLLPLNGGLRKEKCEETIVPGFNGFLKPDHLVESRLCDDLGLRDRWYFPTYDNSHPSGCTVALEHCWEYDWDDCDEVEPISWDADSMRNHPPDSFFLVSDFWIRFIPHDDVADFVDTFSLEICRLFGDRLMESDEISHLPARVWIRAPLCRKTPWFQSPLELPLWKDWLQKLWAKFSFSPEYRNYVPSNPFKSDYKIELKLRAFSDEAFLEAMRDDSLPENLLSWYV